MLDAYVAFQKRCTCSSVVTSVEDEISRITAGEHGEKVVNYYLGFLPKNEWTVVQRVKLSVDGQYFEPDFILLSTNVVVIVEAKNYAGEIYFNEHNQCISGNRKQSRVLPNPVSQVERHEIQLERLLYELGVYAMPIVSLVAMTNPKAKIQTSDNAVSARQKVVQATGLVERINQIRSEHRKMYLTSQKVRDLKKQLNDAHFPYHRHLFTRFKVDMNEVTKSLFCLSCSGGETRSNGRKRVCVTCEQSYHTDDLVVESLLAYKLLVGDRLTNREFREWTGVEDRNTALRMLRRAGLELEGEKYRASYVITDEWFNKYRGI
ncbi:MAG: nuclease-related domain-containing protein [Bacilli bacterium]